MMKIELSLLLVAILSSHVTIGLDVLCPPQWTQWRGGCYRFINNPMRNYEDAQAFCNSVQLSDEVCPDQRAHLVTIDSSDENQFVFDWWITVREPAEAYEIQFLWIDGNDIESEGNFVLTNGNPLPYENWLDGQPNNWQNQDCLCMAKIPPNYIDVGKWHDEKCGKISSFMCEFRCC